MQFATRFPDRSERLALIGSAHEAMPGSRLEIFDDSGSGHARG